MRHPGRIHGLDHGLGRIDIELLRAIKVDDDLGLTILIDKEDIGMLPRLADGLVAPRIDEHLVQGAQCTVLRCRHFYLNDTHDDYSIFLMLMNKCHREFWEVEVMVR